MISKVLALAASVSAFSTLPEYPPPPSPPGQEGPEDLNPCKDAPLTLALHNVPCETASVQSGGNITKGAKGLLEAQLDPLPLSEFEDRGMCPVNVHWHLGAEHFSVGEFDQSGLDWMLQYGPFPGIDFNNERPGFMCRHYDAWDTKFTTPYEWQYCKNMHVGLTYEFHWPHSNLGACGTQWQYQYPFVDGVLCQATIAGVSAEAAVESIFVTERTKISVLGQTFVVVNDEQYAYPEWDILAAFNSDLATDVATYQGSTTGQTANNEECRGTGGMVTWHMDRKCHLVHAGKVDDLCRQMLEQADDMTFDTYPHGSRPLVDPEYQDSSIRK